MNTLTAAFQSLLSDDVFVEGMAASDVRSLWRRLALTDVVAAASRALASDPDRIRHLCAFVETILAEDYDRAYRHPHDIAICAALVVIERSPLSEVRSLIVTLRRMKEPSLVWVQRMAEYCEEKFVPSTTYRISVPSEGDDRLCAVLTANDTPGVSVTVVNMQSAA